MKKILFLILVLLGSNANTLFAQSNQTVLNCKVIGPLGSGLNLYVIANGKAKSLGFQRPDEHGNLSFELDEKNQGIYYFSKAGGKGGDHKHVIYLKKGERKNISFYLGKLSLDYDSIAIVNPNVETKILQQWTNEFNAYKQEVSRNMATSYSQYESFDKKAKQFIQKNKTKNTYFNAWLKDKIETDLLYLKAANFFNFNSRMMAKYDSTANVAWFYEPLRNKRTVSNPALLKSDHGQDLLNYVFGYLQFMEEKSAANLFGRPFSKNLPLIDNDEVKLAYMLNKIPQIKKYEEFLAEVEPNKYLFKTEAQKAVYQKAYEDLYLFAKGTPGYNFSLKDVNDKVHTLESFKGKVVIIDIWAMWCAPCLAEKPVMEKIAENYHDRNDIVFVGISVDGFGKTDAWKGFVKKQGYTSVELLSNPNELISTYYKIEGIPRFLIFDKEGKIVTVDAPRPSNPGFKKIIDEALGLK